MTDSEDKMFDLINDLGALCDDGIPIFPGRMIVNTRELYRILNAFPDAISNEINDAKIILKKKDEIIQDAKLRADRIVEDAKNERYRLLDESSLRKADEEAAEKFRQTVNAECQQIRMSAFNEAQDFSINAKNEALRMREESQQFAQRILSDLEADLNKLYQLVMNGQQRLQEMRQNDTMLQNQDKR